MKKSIVASLAAGVLVLAACGSDSDGASDTTPNDSIASAITTESSDADEASSDGPDGVQGEAAAAFISAATESGITPDEDCVNDLAAQLSDEDAQAIVDSQPDGSPELSAEGTTLTAQLPTCVDNEDLIDAYITQLQATGEEFDEECVRDGLADVNFAELATAEDGDAATEEVLGKVMACFPEMGS